MSIPLTTASFLIQDLSQSEKHILTILCFRADKHHEAYSSIKRLCLDCSCCKNTIARGLKVLRDKGYLVYTGKLAPNSRSIPIYSIQLKHKDQLNNREQSTDTQIGYSQNPRVPNLDSTSTQFGFLRIPNLGTRIDNRVLKTIKKDRRNRIYLQ